MQKAYLTLLIGRIYNFYDRNRSPIILFSIAIIIIILDHLFNLVFPSSDGGFIQLVANDKRQTGIDFAPEVWLSLLSLVLGTLIIVISIASQNTPKLIDLYIKDRISLAYIWFLACSVAHNLWLQFFLSSSDVTHMGSIFLNTYVFLPLALLLSIPYIFYILLYTKTSNVIDKIFSLNIADISKLQNHAYYSLMDDPMIRARYQFRMMEALNQLDDLLEFVSFKEPKAAIIEKIGLTIQNYISIKKDINPSFFLLSEKSRGDISFKTLNNQFAEIEETQTFYEQKAFRLLGNSYFNFIEDNNFDLASLCVSQLASCGKTAVDNDDEPLIRLILVRFNTFLRFGIKHGLKNSEARNIYNAIFSYRLFINKLIETNNQKFIRQSCNYIKIYGTEIFKHSQRENSFTFLVDVFSWEMRQILVSLNENNYDNQFQQEILDLFLQMDNPPDVQRDKIGQTRIINDGVRIMQIGLALYYLRTEKMEFTDKIISDILDDYCHLGKDFVFAVESSCAKIQMFGPTFWEDTDRGNANLYYAEEKEFIPAFLEIFKAKLEPILKK
jgi:hypothetical protein